MSSRVVCACGGFEGNTGAAVLVMMGLGFWYVRRQSKGESNKAAVKAYEKAATLEAEYQIMSKTKQKATAFMDEVQKKIKDKL